MDEKYDTVELEFSSSTVWDQDKVSRWFGDGDVQFLELREFHKTRVICNYNSRMMMLTDIVENLEDIGYSMIRWRYYGNDEWNEN